MGRFLRRSLLAGAAAAGVALLALGAALWTTPRWVTDRLALLHPGCVYRLPIREPLIALTIDDGPDSATTPLILDQLRRHDARATFFLISDRAKGRDSLLRAMVAAGHEIGNHFTRDRPGIRLDPEEFEADLVEAHRELARFGPVSWARPGSGWYTRSMIETLARHGYRCALGSVYPFDVAIPSPAFAARYILRHAEPGAIVILHEGAGRGRRTAETLGRVLPELRRRGYRVVPLSGTSGSAVCSPRSRSSNSCLRQSPPP